MTEWRECADPRCGEQWPVAAFRLDPAGKVCDACWSERGRHRKGCACGECLRAVQLILDLEAQLCQGGKNLLTRSRNMQQREARKAYHRARYRAEKRKAFA